MSSLLPKQYEPREHALEHAGGARLNALPSQVPSLWNADTCPAHHLAHLAAALSVDFWDDAWPTTRKRQMIKQSPDLHRLKGTPAGVVKALSILGYPNSYLVEHTAWQHDGTHQRDGRIQYGQPLKWHEFDVHLQSGATPTAGVLTTLRRYIESFKAAHARLRGIYYGVRKHDGTHQRNGAINYDAGRAYYYGVPRHDGAHQRNGAINYDSRRAYG